MLGVYLRLVLFIAGLIGAVILFAFAFTAAAVIIVIVLLVLAIFGRKSQVEWTFVRSDGERQARGNLGDGPIIDHDPNDLPPGPPDARADAQARAPSDVRRSLQLPPSRD